MNGSLQTSIIRDTVERMKRERERIDQYNNHYRAT
jgi:hypothetical protein